MPEKLPVDNQTEIIVEKVLTKTLESLLPLLQQGAQPGARPVTSQDIRTEVSKNSQMLFDKEVRENQRFLEMVANLPDSEYEDFFIPRVFSRYVGSVLPVSINGSIINIPVNGQKYRIPKMHAAIARTKIAYEDEKANFMDRSNNNDIREVTRETLGQ